MRVPLVMVVHPGSAGRPALQAFIAYAKANPGKISMAPSAGTGNTTHVAGELFKMMTGIDMVHVAYRGDAPALADLIGGRVQVMFGSVAATVEFIRSGKLRAVAVTSTVPAAALPDLPTVAATVPGYEASGWFGIETPQRTPQDVIQRLNDAINAGLADAALKARIAELSGVPLPGSPEDFGRLIASETAKWAQVIRTANIKNLNDAPHRAPSIVATVVKGGEEGIVVVRLSLLSSRRHWRCRNVAGRDKAPSE